jgi:hypothetical protein
VSEILRRFQPIQSIFSDCFARLNMTSSDLDISVYDSLLDFSEATQVEIVNSFCQADLEAIRNKTGYFIGILKQYRKNGKALSNARHVYSRVVYEPGYSVPFFNSTVYVDTRHTTTPRLILITLRSLPALWKW